MCSAHLTPTHVVVTRAQLCGKSKHGLSDAAGHVVDMSRTWIFRRRGQTAPCALHPRQNRNTSCLHHTHTRGHVCHQALGTTIDTALCYESCCDESRRG